MDNDNDYDIQRLQLMQLDILKEVKRVCEKHNFTFYIMNGTCLGAIRHHGFIPWDDDVDIGMYVEDFDEFIKCQNDFDDKFFIQTMETDPEFRTMIARVRMNNTTLIERENINQDINHGIFIDVYPLFGYPKNPVAQQVRSWESLLYRLLLADAAPQNHGGGAALAGEIIQNVIPVRLKQRIIHSIHKKLRSEPSNTRYVAFLYGMDVHLFHTIKYERNWFGEPVMVHYEDIQLPAPTNWDSYLKIRYHDYMQLPPIEKRNVHHDYEFVDLDHSYLNYKGIRYLNGK